VIKALNELPYTEDELIPDLRIYRPATERQVVIGGDTSEGVNG